jgi:class 3 adenylate cyclase
MESSPPFPIEPGGRILAAIVFTDVVNFSARVQAAEVTTLSLLEQDFAVMTKCCEQHSGWMLKSTGDGLLLYFSSAVNAVGCALEIQRGFAQRAQTSPADQTLTHRVGVHLGDIFVKDQDVMGDGVNIASRLQAVADPGGICISQTVYDVVKNKLALEVDRLPARELKNIAEPIPMYRVLLAARKAPPPPPAGGYRPPERAPRRIFTPTEKLLAVLGLGVAAFVLGRLIVQADFSQKKALADSQATQAALNAILAEKKNSGDSVKTATETAVPADPAAAYNFAEMTLRPATDDKRSEAETVAAKQQAAKSAEVLYPWVKAAMARYTKASPLPVPRLGASMPAELRVFTDGDNRFVFATGGATRARSEQELRPSDWAVLVVGTLLDSPAPPPPEVMRGADAFAYLYGLPEVVTALHRDQR